MTSTTRVSADSCSNLKFFLSLLCSKPDVLNAFVLDLCMVVLVLSLFCSELDVSNAFAHIVTLLINFIMLTM